jgi:hypothetical protein
LPNSCFSENIHQQVRNFFLGHGVIYSFSFSGDFAGSLLFGARRE